MKDHSVIAGFTSHLYASLLYADVMGTSELAAVSRGPHRQGGPEAVEEELRGTGSRGHPTVMGGPVRAEDRGRVPVWGLRDKTDLDPRARGGGFRSE